MKKIQLPLKQQDIQNLQAGEEVLLQGPMLVGRDQAHLRLCETLNRGEELPLSLQGEVIYYMGPAPTQPGDVIGSAGPTTAYRMDPFAPRLLDRGLKGMIGKGPRSNEVRQSVIDNGAVYFYAYGGCGALYAQAIKSVELLAYEDLGPEAIYRLQVEDFPVVVAINSSGDSIY
ncbi:MAG: Fe-S-containing hydro-lyase [Spirochaetaceae bacterium]|jgi:fumarate hydratase subunit beta|nr:Fe-S-containing hydro-lyase [Spirochaetaceae bacterium]